MLTEFFLIGDSHSAVIGSAARELGMNFCGGPMAAGRRLNKPFFRIEGEKFIVKKSLAKQRVSLFSELLEYQGPIVTTIGCAIHNFISAAEKYNKISSIAMLNLTQANFTQCVKDSRPGAFDFYSAMAQYNKSVFFVPAPQIFATDEAAKVGLHFEQVLISEFEALGAKLVDIRPETCDKGGVFRADLVSTKKQDSIHGSIEWGKIALQKLRQILIAGG